MKLNDGKSLIALEIFLLNVQHMPVAKSITCPCLYMVELHQEAVVSQMMSFTS
jgi:hypothetical protein